MGNADNPPRQCVRCHLTLGHEGNHRDTTGAEWVVKRPLPACQSGQRLFPAYDTTHNVIGELPARCVLPDGHEGKHRHKHGIEWGDDV